MFQGFLPSFSVFLTYGFQNSGQEVGHRCLPTSRRFVNPHGPTNYSLLLGYRCLFRIPHDFLPLRNHTLKNK